MLVCSWRLGRTSLLLLLGRNSSFEMRHFIKCVMGFESS